MRVPWGRLYCCDHGLQRTVAVVVVGRCELGVSCNSLARWLQQLACAASVKSGEFTANMFCGPVLSHLPPAKDPPPPVLPSSHIVAAYFPVLPSLPGMQQWNALVINISASVAIVGRIMSLAYQTRPFYTAWFC